MPNITKPKFMHPCNHCGVCCQTVECGVSIELGSSVAPCVWLSSKNKCMVVEEEAKAVADGLLPDGPMIANALGIGLGCCTDDEVGAV